jgi:site-specific DNA recombinase
MTKLKAAIYARFSTELQRDASIDDQIRLCEEYASRQGIEIVATYTDRATSGASLMRSGIQSLLRDASSGSFDLVLAEALDRLSRNQADIAGLYQRLQFQGRMIETVSEGSISEMHIGLKGTMNALFLKDLAAKTHRGLKGRALAGKNAGGKAYGYKPDRKFDADGELIRGDRNIDKAEAAVVTRIFTDYANGVSPKKIAGMLNAEGRSGPSGKGWGASTLHGNRERGTGILNNELYIGRQIWNRLTYVKNPDTGKKVSRLNPESAWVITEVPELRIIDQDLWDAVRARQGAMKTKNTDVPIWDRRRPRTLFSGMMACGCCGGGYSKISRDHFGCTANRAKGDAICDNTQTIHQRELEDLVLDAMQHTLMDEAALKIFCEEYVKERNRLRAESTAGRDGLERELLQVKRDHGTLIDAILGGISPKQVQDRMNALDKRRTEIESKLQTSPAPDLIRIHPKMAINYRERIPTLIKGLSEPDGMDEAKDALRSLIERIVLRPNKETGRLSVELEGDLSGLMILALRADGYRRTQKSAAAYSQVSDIVRELVLVAGVGFEPTTFRL